MIADYHLHWWCFGCGQGCLKTPNALQLCFYNIRYSNIHTCSANIARPYVILRAHTCTCACWGWMTVTSVLISCRSKNLSTNSICTLRSSQRACGKLLCSCWSYGMLLVVGIGSKLCLCWYTCILLYRLAVLIHFAQVSSPIQYRCIDACYVQVPQAES